VTVADVVQVVADTLAERADALEYNQTDDATFVVVLPGERKLATTCMLTVGNHGLRVESFVCRHPDQNNEGVYRYLLRRNRRLYTVAYTLDRVGDVYLVGRMPHHAVTPEELDRLFGQILEAVDHDFNILLELGFADSIRREWAWRVSRGESLHNLQAFKHLVEDDH
jgi:hypothetical protein